MKPHFIVIFLLFFIPVFGQNDYSQPATIDPGTAGSGAATNYSVSKKNEILFGVLAVAGSNRIYPKSERGYSYSMYGSNYVARSFNYYSGFGIYSRISGQVAYGEADLESGILREDLDLSLYTYGYGSHGSCQDSYNDHFRLTQNISETKISFLAGVKWFSQSKRFNFETAIGFQLMFDHLSKTFFDEETEINSGTCIQDTTYWIGPASAKVKTNYGVKPGFTFKAGFSYKCSDNICIHFNVGARNSDYVFYFDPYKSTFENHYEYRMELFSTLGCSYVMYPMKR